MKTLVIGGAVLVAVTTAAVAAHATSKGRNGPLAYQAQVGKHVQLFTVRPDGSGARQLTDLTDSDATNAVWSPNGNPLRSPVSGARTRPSSTRWTQTAPDCTPSTAHFAASSLGSLTESAF